MQIAERRAPKVAQRRLEELRDKRRLPSDAGELLPFVAGVRRGYRPPYHLTPLLRLLERAAKGEPVRAVVSAPPRHAKTETILAAFAWLLRQAPERTHGYVTYGAKLAASKSERARAYTLAAGVRFPRSLGSRAEWRTKAGGGLLATGIRGPLTGQGIDGVLVVDDPVKNRVEAESATLREQNWSWFNEVAYTRLEGNASVLVPMARWHPDDLAGRLLKQGGWEHVNLRALDDMGNALWPEVWPAEKLEGIRDQIGPYSWGALYDGAPRPRGGAVFRGVTHYDPAQLPSVLKFAVGLDLAYSARTSSDWSVAIVLGMDESGMIYVLDVVRARVDAPAFGGRLAYLAQRYPRVPMRWYTGGTEIGVAQFLRAGNSEHAGVLDLAAMPAKGDKFVRAQPVAAAWNAGRVAVPRNPTTGASPEWVEGLVSEVLEFTGSGKDGHDDHVDALAAGFDVLAPAVVALPEIDPLLLMPPAWESDYGIP